MSIYNKDVIQSDLDLVATMNPTQRNILENEYGYWPKWAKRDAEIARNYRLDIIARHKANYEPKPHLENFNKS